jgi:hypothetical protein
MDNSHNDRLLELYFKEYEKLKDEQTQRIGFRDNLIYATLVGIAGVISYASTTTLGSPVLLVLPIICFILGWTYLVNDEKISAIGKYIRITLSDKIKTSLPGAGQDIFGWEIVHRSDPKRVSRKILQFVTDEITFVGSGATALIIFWYYAQSSQLLLLGISIIEALLLIILGLEILLYADFKKGR